jgi:hypothetical protein
MTNADTLLELIRDYAKAVKTAENLLHTGSLGDHVANLSHAAELYKEIEKEVRK